MVSTHQPAVGVSVTLKQLKVQWLTHHNDCGRGFEVSQCTTKLKARCFSVCVSAPTTGWKDATRCRAHAKVIGDDVDSVTIHSVNLMHTCSHSASRKRNYLTRDIAEVSDALSLHKPTATKEGNTKQCIKMVKASTGVTLKKGQALLAVRKQCNETLEAQIGQCFWTPSLFKVFNEDDPAGTHIRETRPTTWMSDNNELNQFHRCHWALSAVKDFWDEAHTGLVICDGTFTRSTAFKHVLLIACAFDGNNQLVILAVAIALGENAESWVWFKEPPEEDFPGFSVWMSDADKRITSGAFAASQSQSIVDFLISRCIRHMAENCRESCETGTMNEDHKKLIVQLAKSRTQDIHQQRLEAIKNENEAWAQWLDTRRDEFATFRFLERGHSRCGKVTSNGVENIDSALSDQRGFPIVCMTRAIVECQQKSFV